MQFDSNLLQWLITLEEPAIFFGAFFFGETVILAASFLAAEGVWSLNNVFWLSLLGTVVSDIIWFYAGRYSKSLLRYYEVNIDKYRDYVSYVDAAFEHKPWRTMVFLKFLYGTRIIMIVYLALSPMSLRRFIAIDTFASAVLLAVVMTVGWLAGKGLISAAPAMANLQYGVLGLLGIVIIYKLVTVWFTKQIDETIEERTERLRK